MSLEEMRALVRDLEATEAPRTCPHGRPTLVFLSADALGRQFGR
jgi:DNA mismatch repair protein MutL